MVAVAPPLALSDAAALGLAGIVVSGVLGPAAVGLLARCRQRADHAHERRLKGHDDLAALLDAAAAVLAPGASRLRRSWENAQQTGKLDEDTLGDWASELHITYERLLLRLAETDPISEAYRAARDRLVEVGELIAQSADQQQLDEAVTRFEDARSLFLEQARIRLRHNLEDS